MDYTFLICSERSGSNLLTKIIDANSSYCGPAPAHLFRLLIPNLFRYGPLENKDNWHTLLNDFSSLFDAKLGDWETHVTVGELEVQVTERTLKSLFSYLYSKEAQAHNKRSVFIKENALERYAPYLVTAFPMARYVHMVRDPRDMALSWKRSPTHRGGVMRAASMWLQDQLYAQSFATQLSEHKKIFVLRYEDLVSNAETVVPQLCDFLQVDYEPQMLLYHQNKLTQSNAESTDNWKNIAKPLMSGNFNKYREGLSEAEIRYVESKCASLMEYYGYPSDYAAMPLNEELLVRVREIEPDLKPDYQRQPQLERERRAHFKALEQLISNRVPPPLFSMVHGDATPSGS